MVWFKRIISVVLAILFLALISAYYLLQSSLPATSGIVETEGAISASATIERDALGTAIITAQNRTDAAYALGYAHGQDRFFQLDLQRRFAAGELSALFGPVAIEHDKNYRIHQLRKKARQALKMVSAADKALLDSYVTGVNAGVSSLDTRAYEYLLLQQTPKPWAGEDSLLVSAFMFVQMTGATVRKDYARTLLLRSGGEELLNFIQPRGTIWDTALDGTVFASPLPPTEDVWALNTVENSAAVLADPLPPMKGSNSWAVAGSLTEHGGALLSNDPHLAFSLPHIWYRSQLNYKAHDGTNVQITGVSLPGLPSIAIGTNGYVAWGLTNSAGDWADLISVDVTENKYQTSNGPASLTLETEVIEVAGGNDVELKIKSTHWGPLYEINNETYAWRWLAHDLHSLNPTTFQQLDSAETTADVLEIAKQTGLSPFNMLAADKDGNTGWTIVGHMPQRGPIATERVVRWQDADQTWTGWLPVEDYPEITSETHARIWTANNRIVGSTDLKKIGIAQYELGTRGWLIEQDLKNSDEFNEIDMSRMMENNKAVLLESWQQYLITLLKRQSELSSEQETAAGLIENWTATANTSDVGYTIVRHFRDEFRTQLNAAMVLRLEEDGLLHSATDRSQVWLLSRQSEGALLHLRDTQPPHWLPRGVKSWDLWSLSMLNNVIQNLTIKFGKLELARWGANNKLRMRHPIASSLPGFLADFINMPADELAGDSNMPLAQHPGAGQSMRFVVAPGQETKGSLTLPAGQSGHPLSPYYRTGHDDWLHFKQTPLLPGKIEATLILQP